jgi:hypothetical protein
MRTVNPDLVVLARLGGVLNVGETHDLGASEVVAFLVGPADATRSDDADDQEFAKDNAFVIDGAELLQVGGLVRARQMRATTPPNGDVHGR